MKTGRFDLFGLGQIGLFDGKAVATGEPLAVPVGAIDEDPDNREPSSRKQRSTSWPRTSGSTACCSRSSSARVTRAVDTASVSARSGCAQQSGQDVLRFR